MARISADQVKAFHDRVEQEIVQTEQGKQGLPLKVLQAMIRAEPEVAAVVVQGYAETGGRRNLQIAIGIAAAYQLELGDDSLATYVEGILEKTDAPADLAKFVPMEGAEEEKPPILIAQVEPGWLEEQDIYPFQRQFSVDLKDPEDWAELKQQRGLYLLVFPVDADPRPVWEIPEVRGYVARLFEEMPYFPYYLDPQPELGMLLLFFGCVADPEATDPQGILDLTHPSVLEPVVLSLLSIMELCSRFGEDGREVCRLVLAAFPDHLRERFLSALKG